jgi:hypothetical protein
LARQQASTALVEDAKSLPFGLQSGQTETMTSVAQEPYEPLDGSPISAARTFEHVPPENLSDIPSTPNGTSSPRSPKHFNISDDEIEEERPSGIPNYDLTDDPFKVFQGKLDQERIDKLKYNCTRVARLGKHLQAHPRDDDGKFDRDVFREVLAKHFATLRIDATDLGLDNKCLQVLDSLEKDLGVPKKVRKQAFRRATELRKSCPFGEDEREDPHERG